MISPEELKEQMKVSQYEKDMTVALKKVDKEIREALENGQYKIMLPNVQLSGAFFFEEIANLLAERLLRLGYKCRKEDGTWYLYFH